MRSCTVGGEGGGGRGCERVGRSERVGRGEEGRGVRGWGGGRREGG